MDESLSNLKNEFAGDRDFESGARRLVEKMALTLQGSLLVRHGHPAVADAFCASRLAGNHGAEYGTLPANTAVDEIIDRATPKLN